MSGSKYPFALAEPTPVVVPRIDITQVQNIVLLWSGNPGIQRANGARGCGTRQPSIFEPSSIQLVHQSRVCISQRAIAVANQLYPGTCNRTCQLTSQMR